MMPASPDAPPPRNDPPRPVHRWYHVVAAAALIAVCTSMGLFLVIFPWSALWDANSYVLELPALQDYWSSPYLRGAVSGLGILNLIFALVDLIRFRRFFEP